MKNNDIKAGEKVDLYLGKGPYYRSMVEDTTEDDTYLVSVPTFRGIPIILKQDQEINLYFYRENGRYIINTRVIDFEISENVRMVRLVAMSEAERQQRRQSFRVSTLLRTILRPYDLGPFPRRPNPAEEHEMEDAPTFNLSATGVAIRTTRDHAVGDKLFLKIFLAWPKSESVPLEISGEIKQIAKTDSVKDIFQLGIMFVDASEEMSAEITKFVLAEEQRQRKKMLFIGKN
ncbi:MAG: flagellar brake protein [Oscillospiraceae bacterium]|nr:flagellar brake protein [Oscillospiraceae bacterium]